MNDSVNSLKKAIETLSEDDRISVLHYISSELKTPLHQLERAFGTSAAIILEAIHRGSDLTQRGVRGIIAEAIFDRQVATQVKGWLPIDNSSPSADFTFKHEETGQVRSIQTKLQRKEAQKVKLYNKKGVYYGWYVVEIQKTRNGKNRDGESSRPYRFSDFNILAVCMQPSSNDWTKFMYCSTNHLIPRAGDSQLIEIMQPVPHGPTNFWYDDLTACLNASLIGPV